MGNSDNSPERRQAVARHVRAALVGDPDRDQRRACRSPSSSSRRTSRPPRSTRSRALKPGPFTRKTVEELFLPGTVPTPGGDQPRRRPDRRGVRPALAGGLRRAAGHPRLLRPRQGRGRPSRTGRRRTPTGVPGRPRAPACAAAPRAPGPRSSTTTRSRRSGAAGVRRLRPTELCPIVPVICDPFAPPDPLDPFCDAVRAAAAAAMGSSSVPDLRCLTSSQAADVLTGRRVRRRRREAGGHRTTTPSSRNTNPPQRHAPASRATASTSSFRERNRVDGLPLARLQLDDRRAVAAFAPLTRAHATGPGDGRTPRSEPRRAGRPSRARG